MRVKLTVEYDGTEYCGWQVQPNGVTVQQRLNEAVRALTGEDVTVTGSGRTDAGVHAMGQVAHFDTASTIPAERFSLALNTLLPKDIRVLSSERAEDDFHARFCAKSKTYCYKMYRSDVVHPLMERYSAMVSKGLDIAAMQECAKLFVGTHDFKAFMASGSAVKDTVRTVFSAEVTECGSELCFTVCGNGFLYNMVRIMAGTLVGVGTGRLTPDDVTNALSGGERCLAGKTLPPNGLTLVRVDY